MTLLTALTLLSLPQSSVPCQRVTETGKEGGPGVKSLQALGVSMVGTVTCCMLSVRLPTWILCVLTPFLVPLLLGEKHLLPSLTTHMHQCVSFLRRVFDILAVEGENLSSEF